MGVGVNALCNNISRRQLLSKVGIQRLQLQHSGNNSEQCGNNEPALVEESSGTELDGVQLPAMTDAATELKMKTVARLKVTTQP